MLKDYFKEIYRYVYTYIQKADTRTLISVPFVLGLLLASVFITFFKHKYGYIPNQYNNYIGASTLLIWGLSGVSIVVRKEFPLYVFDSIEGIVPIIIGTILIVLFWGGALKIILQIMGI